MINGMRATDVSLLIKWVQFNGDAPMYVLKQGVATNHIAPFPAKNGSLAESMLGKHTLCKSSKVANYNVDNFLWYQIKHDIFRGFLMVY